MDDFWAGALWALKIWLYLIIILIMIPSMFGFSLGISEIYMTILVKTLEVLTRNFYVPHRLICFKRWRYFDSWPLIYAVCSPQWATLNIQKANSDEGTLKPSSSNGK